MGTGSVHHLGLQCSLRDLLAVCLIQVMGTDSSPSGSVHHLSLFTQGSTCCGSDSGHGDRVCSPSGSVHHLGLFTQGATCGVSYQASGKEAVHHLGPCTLVFYMLCVCFSQL